ncbi:hypothetical protein EI94DRAFT_1851024, partial [Lactarius quietus]
SSYRRHFSSWNLSTVRSLSLFYHTLELPYQIKHEYLRFAKYMPDILVGMFFDGTLILHTTEPLKDKSKCPHIIVATPGRLNALVQDKVLD